MNTNGSDFVATGTEKAKGMVCTTMSHKNKMKGVYVFVYGSISDVGGRQLYLLNKSKFLKENGWQPLIITSDDSNIMIGELKSIVTLVVPEIEVPFLFLRKKSRDSLIKNICNFINVNKSDLCMKNRVIVESQEINQSFWGEVIAEKFKTINFTYVIGWPMLIKLERFYYDYYKHKQLRNELIGVAEPTLKIMFEGIDDINLNQNTFFNIPFNVKEIVRNNVNSEINKYKYSITNCDYVITTISRLSKPYINVLIKDIIKLSHEFSDKKFALIIVGDDINAKFMEYYRYKYSEYINSNNKVKLIFTGYIRPLTKDIFEVTDIFVGMGTAVINAVSQGCPSICVDPRGSTSSGIFGIDLTNFAFAEKKQNRTTLDSELRRLLKDNELWHKASNIGKKVFDDEYEHNKVNKHFLDFCQRRVNDVKTDYYSYDNNLNYYMTDFKFIMFRLTGFKLYNYIRLLSRRIKSTTFKLFNR